MINLLTNLYWYILGRKDSFNNNEMSKRSKKKKRKFWKSKLPKITISIEVVSNDGFKEEESNGLDTKE